ncbi:hypothetical protein J4Q44_G00221410 [Coregonus suidteri]|uniref:C2H2-type domain-containing protein n=1 Tax=Coregonus suidteri TaxID=861788 RepID=A0AAN8QQJ2_9TELE
MADSDVEPEPDWSNRPSNTAEDTLVAMECLLTTLRALEATLRQQDISEISSTEYCDNFCQALMDYAGSRNSVEHGLPLLEVYCLAINCFAASRPHLTADSDTVALVLKRLALSCFELLLSVPENEIPYEAWVQFHRSVQVAHDALLEYGSIDLQALLQITGEGGAWSNPVLSALLTGHPTTAEEVDAYISLEGEGFMEMRVKHLEKVGEVAKAVVLAKACAECHLVSNQTTFRQTYVSLLCQLLPGEEAIMEISRLDCKDVLDITCNLETEGEDNTAFILCTTFLTQQLQQQSLYCSWELTLLWSKLQRRIDPSLESLLERCLQLGAIAKTVYHLLFLVRVIRTEAEELGLASSVELCVKALQLPKQEDTETRISVCNTVSCLLPDDLEVLRACQLTEFLLGLSHVAFSSLQELYLRPDQKYDQENAIIPNSLRCELLLALKAHWPFDPEFWDWKTLKHQCIMLLGLEPEPEEEEKEGGQEEVSLEQDIKEEVEKGFVDMPREYVNGTSGSIDGHYEENERDSKPPSKPDDEGTSEQGSLQKKYKFFCKICKKSVTETRILLHSKRHEENGISTCPVCLKKFKSRKDFIPHTKLHLQMPSRSTRQKKKDKKRIDLDKEMEEDDLDDLEPGEIALDPSLMLYYQSTHDPDVLEHILEQASSAPRKPGHEDNVTFDYINVHFELQNRDIYTCPAAHCTKTFKHSKYLGVHLKSEDHVGDENVKHYFEMRDRREKCTYCRRHFMSAYHHRRHRRVHYGDLPYMCMVTGCGARFSTSNELVAHKQSHGFQLSYQCELKGCSLSFCDLGQVYHHEAQHFRDAAYSCTSLDCKKFYFSKKEFGRHLATHGITFSEEDFEAQRKAKRKHLDSITEEIASPKKYCDTKTVLEEVVNGENNAASSTCSASHMSSCKEPKGTMASVAVCFDGKKFTCGFERCGLTFSKARDVHQHLRCVHPEHFKTENKERKNLVKEKGLKSKGLKDHFEEEEREDGGMRRGKGGIYTCKHKDCGVLFSHASSLYRHQKKFHSPVMGHPSVLSEDPALQKFRCSYANCNASYLLNSSLNTHKDTSATGCQKKLIITSTPQKDATKLPLRQSLRHCPKSPEDVKAEETSEERDEDDGEHVLTEKKSRRFEDMVFRSHEEALQMCQDRCQREAYPCMVQGCDSVVKFIRSMRRHYLNCHKLTNQAFELNEDKLVFSAEKLDELIQRNTVLSACPDMTRAPNGVLKMEYQAEPENPGGPSVPMSLHSIEAETLDEHDPLGFKEEPPAERNVLVGADDLLYGEPSGHTEEPAIQNSQEERPRRKSSNPPALDLSPPSSLRFSVDEGFMDSSGKDGGKPTIISVPLPSPQARQPLKRKNELSELPPIPKDPQPHSPPPRTFDLATYKPMGFESSFLKFIQESTKDDVRPRASHCNSHRPEPPVVSARRRDSYRRNCSVKENSQMGLTTTRSRRARSSPLQPLPRTGEYTSVQNLRLILEKALTGCGDLAIKQLQYLRPVVVLERPMFSTPLLDLFPTKTNDKLLLEGS